MKILTNLDLSQNQVQNIVLQPLASAPATPIMGQIYYNSTSGKIYQFNGEVWTVVGTVVQASTENGKINIDGSDITVFVLPQASADTLGGIKVGNGLSMSATGVLSVTDTEVNWGEILGKPTTISGYGITDAKIVGGTITLGANTITPVVDNKYVHTDNNFTTGEKNKLEGIASGAEVNVNPDWNATTGDAQILNKPTTLGGYGITDANIANGTVTLGGNTITPVVDNDYVHTDNNFTAAEKTKLSNIAAGAEVNVQSDWNATAGDSFILNKPTKLSDFTNDENFIDNTVSNLVNYYKKTETYTQAEVNNLIAGISTIQFQVVAELPATGQSNIIYLVPKTQTQTENIYDEYVWIGTDYELIGSTGIDLSNYLQLDGDGSNVKVTFTTATARNNIVSGETLATLMGKIAKYFGDLGTFAYKSSIATSDLPAGTVVDNDYVHTDNNFTTTEKTKLGNIADGAEVNVQSDWNATSGDAQILHKPTTVAGYGITDAKIANGIVTLGTNTIKPVVDNAYIHTDNNFTTPEKTKLSGIQEGAQVNNVSRVTSTLATTENTKTISVSGKVLDVQVIDSVTNEKIITDVVFGAADGGTSVTVSTSVAPTNLLNIIITVIAA